MFGKFIILLYNIYKFIYIKKIYTIFKLKYSIQKTSPISFRNSKKYVGGGNISYSQTKYFSEIYVLLPPQKNQA